MVRTPQYPPGHERQEKTEEPLQKKNQKKLKKGDV